MNVVLGVHLRSDGVRAVLLESGADATVPQEYRAFDFPAELRLDGTGVPRLADPHHLSPTYRGFVDRVDDPVPVMPNPRGPAIAGEVLISMLVESAIDEVIRITGLIPERVMIAHPAYWKMPQVKAFHDALDAYGTTARHRALLVPEADAAVYGLVHRGDIDSATSVVVADLRRDAGIVAYLRRPIAGEFATARAHRFAAVGTDTLDDAVVRRVRRHLDANGSRVPDHPALLARLRARCTAARRSAAHGQDTFIAAEVPTDEGLTIERIPLEHSMFEEIIAPYCGHVVGTMHLASEGEPRPEAVVLIGAAADLDDLTTTCATAFDAPVVVARDAEHSGAFGAALMAAHSPIRHEPTPVASSPTTRRSASEPRAAAAAVTRAGVGLGQRIMLAVCAVAGAAILSAAAWGAIDIGGGTQVADAVVATTTQAAQ